MGGIEEKFILLLSTYILSVAILGLFWSPVENFTVCNRLYVNNEASFYASCFRWDNLCICPQLKVML
jgi:hypothetical protein